MAYLIFARLNAFFARWNTLPLLPVTASEREILMDCVLDCDTLESIGDALRKAYQPELEEEIPSELVRLCAELEHACGPDDGARRR